MRERARLPHGTFATRLRCARLDKGWTRDQLARRAGVTVQTIGAWEGGRRRPTDGHLIAVAEALRVAASWLLDGSSPTGAPL